MHLILVLLATLSAPADVYENLLLVPVRVEGRAMTFLVDTAAPTSYIDPKHGIAAGPAELDLGGGRIAVQLQHLDLSGFAVSEGRALDGIIGMDVFTKYAVEMDFDAGLVRLHDANGYRYSGSGAVVPVTIVASKPYLRAPLKIPGRRATMRDFLIDSGSGGALADELFKPKGEPIGPDLGRADWVKLGPFTFRGANGTTGRSMIGGELLHRFNVIADFARNRMILEPNRHYADALLFDTSGLDVIEASDGLQIATVYPRTPAAEAKLQPGDVITRIDGQPSRNLGANRVRLMFHQVRTHELTVRRGGETMQVTLVLRKLL
ncbi:MAG TPA: PDZ domain-containing protein [Thermoanaerobaculia bacterium]|jgi:hypothetical protein